MAIGEKVENLSDLSYPERLKLFRDFTKLDHRATLLHKYYYIVVSSGKIIYYSAFVFSVIFLAAGTFINNIFFLVSLFLLLSNAVLDFSVPYCTSKLSKLLPKYYEKRALLLGIPKHHFFISEVQIETRDEEDAFSTYALRDWGLRHMLHKILILFAKPKNREVDFFRGCSSLVEARKRYKELMKSYHPDNNQNCRDIYEEIIFQYEHCKNQLKT